MIEWCLGGRRVRKKAVALALTVGMIGSMSASVFANPADDINQKKNELNRQKNELNWQKNQLKKNKDLYEDAERKIEEIETSIERLDAKIENFYREINQINIQIDDTKENIVKSQGEIEIAQEDLQDEQELFDKRMRAMYINGVDNYLEIILDSKGFDDFLSRVELIKDIIQYDKKIINDLKEKKKEIENKKVALEAQKDNLIALKGGKEEMLVDLKTSRSEQGDLIEQADEKRRIYASRISSYNDKIRRTQSTVQETMRLIDEMAAALPPNNSNPSRGQGTVSASANAVVAYSRKFLGIPYEWGGNGPKTFDCSGFVKYVYANFGIKISRTTYTQIKEGKYVSRDNLQPGDLVFFGSSSNPHHVGMYVGNNCYIHAPRTGDVIKISPLTRRDYLTARRILP
jgi:peptidoglycan hydrolase CwlO-like protein